MTTKKEPPLLGATVDWVSNYLLYQIDKITCKSSSPLSSLEQIFMMNISLASSYPSLPRTILSSINKKNTLTGRLTKTLIYNYKSKLNRLFVKAIKKNELPSHLDADTATTIFIGTIQGLIIQSLILNDPELLSREASNAFEHTITGFLTKNSNTKALSRVLTHEETAYINRMHRKQ